jgi:hypothetical protein
MDFSAKYEIGVPRFRYFGFCSRLSGALSRAYASTRTLLLFGLQNSKHRSNFCEDLTLYDSYPQKIPFLTAMLGALF